MPFSPLRLLLLIIALAFVLMLLQLGILTVAFGKLGLSAHSAYLLLITTLIGSMVNVPLFRLPAERGIFPEFPGGTVIAVNVGGCVVPLSFCIYLLRQQPLPFSSVFAEVALVSLLSYVASRKVPGIGIGMPIFVAPIVAAMGAVVLDSSQAAPLAYIGGTLGVLIGADLLHLRDIRNMNTPFASIGGAGSFDGIFLTGIIAVLLA